MDRRIMEHLRAWYRTLRALPTVPSRLRQELAGLRELRADVHRLRSVVDGTERENTPDDTSKPPIYQEIQRITEALDRLPEQLQEHSLLMETALRGPQQAAAEALLHTQLPPCTSRIPGLSVLVPCWHHGGLLEQAVESALQSLNELEGPGEVIVLDDASRDESRKVARTLAYHDSRVQIIESDANLGLARARNVLLGQARHHHAVMLDADNRLIPGGVKALFESAIQTSAVLAHGTIIAVDESEKAIGLMSHRPVAPELADQNWIDALAIVQTERLLELGGYEAGLLTAICDWELVLRLMRLGEPIVQVPTPVGIYRSSNLSMIHDAVDRQRVRRLQRMYAIDGAPSENKILSAIHHPATGYLQRSPSWKHGMVPELQQFNSHAASQQFLVVTSGGVRNHGDDAILLSTLDRLSRIRPDADIIVVSDGADVPPMGRQATWAGTCQELCQTLNPIHIQEGCAGYPTLENSLLRWIGEKKSVGQCPIDFSSLDAVLFAGGGNLASYWPTITAWRTAIAAAARAHGVPYVFSGQGVGPIDEGIMPPVRFLAENASRFATRDAFSAELLKANVRAERRIDVVGDDALGSKACDSLSVHQWLAEIGIPRGTSLLGFHARRANYTGIEIETMLEHAKAIDELARLSGHAVLCIPINSQPQAPEVELLAELAAKAQSRAPWYVADASDDPKQVIGLIRNCSTVVTQSFHMALHAMEKNIPTLLVAATEYYDRKGRGLAHNFGTPVPITITPHASPTAMLHRLGQLQNQAWSPSASGETVDAWLAEALPGTKRHLINAAA